MKVLKVLGKIVTVYITLIIIAEVAFCVILAKEKKDAEADCVMIEALVETIEEAKYTPEGSLAMSRDTINGEPWVYNVRFNIDKNGCSIENYLGMGEFACETMDLFETAMDSVDPDWRKKYASKGSGVYQINVRVGSGEIRYIDVPYGFRK